MLGHSLWGSMTLGKGQLGHYPLASSSPWAATAMLADGSLQPWDAHGPLSTNVHDTLPSTTRPTHPEFRHRNCPFRHQATSPIAPVWADHWCAAPWAGCVPGAQGRLAAAPGKGGGTGSRLRDPGLWDLGLSPLLKERGAGHWPPVSQTPLPGECPSAEELEPTSPESRDQTMEPSSRNLRPQTVTLGTAWGPLRCPEKPRAVGGELH